MHKVYTGDYYGARASAHQSEIDAQAELSTALEARAYSISLELSPLRGMSFREIAERDENGSLQRMNDFFEVAQEMFLPCFFTLVAMSRKSGMTDDDKRELVAYLKNLGDQVIDVMARKEIEA